MLMQSLIQVPAGTSVRIIDFAGGKDIHAKLRQYGLFIGDTARIIRKAPFAGPVLIEINGRELALGRGIAAKIFVGFN